MTPADRLLLTKLLALPHPKLPGTNRFRLRKASKADFAYAVEARGTVAAPPKKDVLAAFRDDLQPLAGEDAGGMFVEWTAGPKQLPIVWLSSEGEIAIAASSARELFGMLARCAGDGWTCFDAISYASWELLALDVEKAASARRMFEDAPAAIDEQVRDLLAAHDVPVVDDLLACARAAAQRYLWRFIERLDMIVTGHSAQRTWFDAWNQPGATLESARAFSPKERYQVGERVTYVYNKDASGLGPQRAVVLAQPAPNRVLLADRSHSFLRAYT